MHGKEDLSYSYFVVITFFILASIAGIWLALRFNEAHGFFTYTTVPTSTLVAAIPVPIYDAPFDETGTLIWYRNNVRPEPWIFYHDTNGRLASKTLTFDVPTALPYTSTTIHVTGLTEDEHVRVRSLTLVF